MIKEKKILLNFTSYILVGLLICLVGLLNVNASTYNSDQFTAQLYDNYGPNLSSVTTEMTSGGWQGIIPVMTANSSGAAWGISSPVTFIANHTYSLTAEITGTYAGKIVLSTYNRIGIGTTLANAKTSYQNNTNVKEIYSKVQDNGITIQFAFTPSVNGSYLIFPFATNSNAELQYFRLFNIVIDDLGSESLTEEQITNSLNAQKNELNASINNMGEEIKGGIKDTFEDCRDSVNIAYNVQYAETGNDWWSIVNVIQTDIKQGETYTISVDIEAASNTIAYWNNSDGVFNTSEFTVKKGLNRYSYTFIALKNATSISQTLTKYGNGDGVVISSSKLQIQKGSVATPYEEPNKQICINKIDETNNKLDQTNQQLGDLNNNITNDNIDNNNVSNAFNEFEDFIDENATISSLITLPVTLFTAILNGMQNSCTPFNLGSLYGEDLILPCINISKYLGNTLWTMIDIIISGFAIYFISKKFIKVFNNFSSMKEGDVIDD